MLFLPNPLPLGLNDGLSNIDTGKGVSRGRDGGQLQHHGIFQTTGIRI